VSAIKHRDLCFLGTPRSCDPRGLTNLRPPCLLHPAAVQTKAFGNAETDQLYADDAAAKIKEAQTRLQAIPGMVPPNQVNDDMADA
jgi:hypothetical protein